jgi:hypothetical protein
MHKNATKCNKTQRKWCINKHGASKIINTFETYHSGASHSVLEAYVARIRHFRRHHRSQARRSLLRWPFPWGAATLVLLAYSRFFLAYSCIRGGSRVPPPSFPVPPAVSSSVPVNYWLGRRPRGRWPGRWPHQSVSVARVTFSKKSFLLLIRNSKKCWKLRKSITSFIIRNIWLIYQNYHKNKIYLFTL